MKKKKERKKNTTDFLANLKAKAYEVFHYFYNEVLICPQRVFLLCGLLFGIIQLFLMPPLQVADELAHLLRAYQVSDGKFFAIEDGKKVGGFIPESILEWREETEKNIPVPYNVPERVKPSIDFYEDILIHLGDDLDLNNKQFFEFSSSAVYSPVPYIPQAIGMNIGKLFKLSPLAIFYLGRLTNLLVSISIIYFAIKESPILKWVLVLLALMPMSLCQLASLSADAFTISISFLTISLVLKAASSKESQLSFRDLVPILMSGILLSLSKQAYFLVPFLIFIVPIKKFRSIKHYLLTLGAIVFITTLPSILWSWYAKDLYAPSAQDRIDFQRSSFLEHPIKTTYAFFNDYYKDRGSIFESALGVLGWGDTRFSFLFHLYPYSILLFIVAIIDKNQRVILNILTKIKIATILVLSAFLITLSLFIFWTHPKSQGAEGIVGRYFIPLLPLLFLILYNQNFYFKTEFKYPKILIFLTLTYSGILTCLELVRTYYV